MNSDYVAWNGERYVWPPPDGWYLASDGRYWAPDTGPEMEGWADQSRPSGASEAAPGPITNINDADQFDASAAASPASASFETSVPHPARIQGGETQLDGAEEPPASHFGDVAPIAAADVPRAHFDSPAATLSHTPDASATPLATPTMPGADRGRPPTGEVAAVSGNEESARFASSDNDYLSRRHVDEHIPPAQHPATSETPRILAEAEAPRAQINRPKTIPTAAAGLLVAAALGIAALLAFLGGDDTEDAQQPSASLDATDETGGLVVTTSPEDGALQDGAMADGAMEDGAMEDGAMEDGAMEEDAMVEEDSTADSTSTTAATGTDTDGAARIGQFRTLLEDNQITAAELTGDDLAAFGVTACSYAQNSQELSEYQEIRAGVIEDAQNEELTVDELQFIIDAAVTVFCPEDAQRLGITTQSE